MRSHTLRALLSRFTGAGTRAAWLLALNGAAGLHVASVERTGALGRFRLPLPLSWQLRDSRCIFKITGLYTRNSEEEAGSHSDVGRATFATRDEAPNGYDRRSLMETSPERSGLICGICGATAEELASPLHPPLDAAIVIRTHVLEAHEVSVEALEESVQIGATWTLSDGRVWMREVRSEGA
jgi:hypothetical protein